ncbi:hypothetical protein E8E12_007313 [Didymella heteroderae]|uniref:Metallo-beta-lactamase domain-containing protein n=1 Tax=Didymella heteroderae TaxID=1769908 RepID=A0A9P4WLX0_9PLEO|nr:hypothetical protein E8E12_007313 [Didymella heteroderae]
MSVLKPKSAGEHHHDRAGREPAVIQGDVIVLFLLIGVCIWIWHAAFRKTPELEAPRGFMQRQLDACPFTIRQINKTTYLIRELDRFDENPHIYVKKHTQILADGRSASLLIVNDTGCGTSVSSKLSRTGQWNIRTFIDHHLNPSSTIPYLVILSHCHYDHILGLNPILRPAHMTHSTRTLIVSSAHDPSFISPSNLRKHSLCGELGLRLPPYQTGVWAQHAQSLDVVHPKLGAQMQLPITALHTPGHTPDSLSWYDRHERALYVGDAFYEAPAPTLFPNEGDLKQWWESVDMLVAFVREQNAEGASRVTLSAGHVTAGVDALDCLLGIREFMTRVLRNEVPFEEEPMKRGERFGSWKEDGGRFSLGAPLRLIEEGRSAIPVKYWMESVKLV